MNEDELKIYYFLNEERKNAGLKAFIFDARLAESARKTSEHLIKNEKTVLDSGELGFLQYIREASGDTYHRFGKISAMGLSLEKIMESIKKCSGKNSYLLDPRYTHMGTAVINYYQRIKLATVHFCAKE